MRVIYKKILKINIFFSSFYTKNTVNFCIYRKKFFQKNFLFIVFFIQNLLKYSIITKNPHLKDEDFLTLQKKVVHY